MLKHCWMKRMIIVDTDSIWFIISTGFLYILHEQHGLVALHAAGSTAAVASKQCDIQQQHWRLRGLHFHQMVPDAVNRIARWIRQVRFSDPCHVQQISTTFPISGRRSCLRPSQWPSSHLPLVGCKCLGGCARSVLRQWKQRFLDVKQINKTTWQELINMINKSSQNHDYPIDTSSWMRFAATPSSFLAASVPRALSTAKRVSWVTAINVASNAKARKGNSLKFCCKSHLWKSVSKTCSRETLSCRWCQGVQSRSRYLLLDCRSGCLQGYGFVTFPCHVGCRWGAKPRPPGGPVLQSNLQAKKLQAATAKAFQCNQSLILRGETGNLGLGSR